MIAFLSTIPLIKPLLYRYAMALLPLVIASHYLMYQRDRGKQLLISFSVSLPAASCLPSELEVVDRVSVVILFGQLSSQSTGQWFILSNWFWQCGLWGY